MMHGYMLLRAALLAALASLAACGGKPPNCADQQTLGVVHDIVVDNVRRTISTQADVPDITREPEFKSRVLKFGESFAAGLKVELVNIVSNGYKADARKYTCAGQLSVIDPVSGEGQRRQIEYAVQSTEDNKSKFLVRIDAFSPFITALVDGTFGPYAEARVKADGAATAAAQRIKQPPAVPVVEAGPTMPVTTPPAPVAATASPVPTTAVVSPSASAQPVATGSERPPTPSFDCDKASTVAERLICTDGDLADADMALSFAYQTAIKTALDKDAVRRAQAMWRKAERDACADAKCMLGAYQRRLAQLQGVK